MKILVWEMRTSKGFTLMELSKKSGIGKSTINNIENGKVSPTLFQLEMIAIALGVKITDLFESEYKTNASSRGYINSWRIYTPMRLTVEKTVSLFLYYFV